MLPIKYLVKLLIQSMWVTDSRMLCSLHRSSVVHPVNRFDSEGWFSSDPVIFLTMFCVFWYNFLFPR